jgi:hypothetical protein
MFKVEISFGYAEPEKITIETFDFDKVKILQEFIMFQEKHGWAVNYEAVTIDDSGFDSD